MYERNIIMKRRNNDVLGSERNRKVCHLPSFLQCCLLSFERYFLLHICYPFSSYLARGSESYMAFKFDSDVLHAK
jgi:hypothetical protein